MKITTLQTIVITSLLMISSILCWSFIQQKEEKEERHSNLKVLSNDLTGDELHAIMRTYSKSLGVRCKHCHAATTGEPPHIDFASDENPKKDIARKMIKMVEAINKKYIGKIKTYHLDPITCVTCHMGNVSPTVSVDSLPKQRVDSLRKG